MKPSIVSQEFFDRDPLDLAVALLGKVLRHRLVNSTHGPVWLAARIIETEAYFLAEKGSHSSRGLTEKRRAMFMAPGTIYMYYSRGKDSLNFSARGEGNGVLIKAAFPFIDRTSPPGSLEVMRALNPATAGPRPAEKLCSGQTLLCRSLGLKVSDWNQKTLQRGCFRLEYVGYTPTAYVQCRRLGIPIGRDEHLPYRFVDFDYAKYATNNPLTKRSWRQGRDYEINSLQTEGRGG